MATYWKSQPKKHCDFCHCWIADNRASIDFHERGKRHQENVEKKLSELRKKGHEQYKMQQTLDKDLIKMEAEALKAFKKDLANDPALAAEYKAKAAAAAASAATAAKKKEELLKAARKLHREGLASNKQPAKASPSSTAHDTASSAESTAASSEAGPSSKVSTATTADSLSPEETVSPESNTQCIWLEGTSPEGYTYYWNTVTGESKWEKPEDYVESAESIMYKEQSQAVSDEQEEKLGTETLEASPKQEPQEAEDDDEPKEGSKEEQAENKEEEGKDEENEDNEEGEDEEEDKEIQRPVKRKQINPYGGWTTIVPDDTPAVDLQLPTPDRPHFQPVVPQAAQHQPREKVKFKERTVSSLQTSTLSSSSQASGQTSFKKRKFGGGGRSIRQRDADT